MILNKQNYKRTKLNNKLYLIQKDKKDLIYIKNEIIISFILNFLRYTISTLLIL